MIMPPGRSDRLTSNNNSCQADPGKDGDAAERADASKAENGDGGNCHEHSSTSPMSGHGVETNGDTEHARAGSKDQN